MVASDDGLLNYKAEVAPNEASAVDGPGLWRILIVDDEEDVHTATCFALNDYIYLDKRIQFISAYNETEAQLLLRRHSDVSLVILDVIMTTPHSGLNLVKFIRDELCNQQVQIILRTGQPSDIPEEQMVKRYCVNDYKLKTELTRDKLFIAVTLALRSYQQVKDLAEANRQLKAANDNLGVFNSKLQSLVDERTQELTQKSLRLADALHDKTSLLRIMAHDLRNYLSIAKWSSERALKTAGDGACAKMIAKIAWAVDQQSELIDKVASLEALHSGKQLVACHATELRTILEHAEQTFEQCLGDKQLKLRVYWRCPSEVSVMVDAVIFANSVINNIVSNAIKFSHAGDTIAIDVVEQPPDRVHIKVTDHGVGIPPEVLEGLFGFSTQTSRSGTGGERGTGFGMPIARLLLEKMNGQIAVKSKVKGLGTVDHGTEVTIAVPRAFA